MAKCPNCGAPMQGNTCSYCGYQDQNAQGFVFGNTVNNVYVQQEKVSDKSKITAFILFILFGYIGLHYFYVGKAGTGVLTLGNYILLIIIACFSYVSNILFIFMMLLIMEVMIRWIIDFIKILSGTFKDGNGLPLRDSF